MYVGIDVGGTKTHVRVEGPESNAHQRRVLTREWLQNRTLEDPASVSALLNLVSDVGGEVEGAPLVVGAHGCDTPSQIEAFKGALSAQHSGPVLVTNDASLIGPAVGADRAIGVIAGTGSVVVGTSANGTPVMAGGHGWMIADPGSAPGIAREAVRTVLLQADAGAAPGSLAWALMNHFEVSNVNELAWSFISTADMHRWAGAAPIVFAVAEEGSSEAVSTIERAASELARQVASVIARGAAAEVIVAAGGVISNQPLLAQALETELVLCGVDLPFRVLEGPPVAGAVALARRLAPSATEPGEAVGHQTGPISPTTQPIAELSDRTHNRA